MNSKNRVNGPFHNKTPAVKKNTFAKGIMSDVKENNIYHRAKNQLNFIHHCHRTKLRLGKFKISLLNCCVD